MKHLKHFILPVLIVAVFLAAKGCSDNSEPVGTFNNEAAYGPKPKMDPITIECFSQTQYTITLKITAGASGAPAGFSVQWVKHADYPSLSCAATNQGNIWPASDDPNLCKASFSGSPWCSNYNLTPGQVVYVVIGNLFDDECGVGITNDCGSYNEMLECNTEYVFRGFAHANNQKQRSEFTGNICCSTGTCPQPENGCTYSYGHWKNHGCDWPSPFVPGLPYTAPTSQIGYGPNGNCLADVTNTLVIGNIAYNQLELLTALDRKPSGGNKLVTLAHHLIALKLSSLNGWTPGTQEQSNMDAADLLIGNMNILTGSSTSTEMSELSAILDGYVQSNHCE